MDESAYSLIAYSRLLIYIMKYLKIHLKRNYSHLCLSWLSVAKKLKNLDVGVKTTYEYPY